MLVLAPLYLNANPDSISQKYSTRLIANLAALNVWYNGTDFWTLEGEFKSTGTTEFSNSIDKNSLFTLELGAEAIFRHLSEMSSDNQQAFIRSFSLYDAVMHSELKEASLPDEIRFLAPALSAMNPMAVGEHKRAGIWQLNHFQGVLNGLNISDLLDERYNETLATKAFVNQIKQNETLFGNTELAILAYLAGKTKLRNAMASLGDDYSLSELLEVLPEHVSTKLAAFQACRFFLSQNTFEPKEGIVAPDTVIIRKQTHFKQICGLIDVPEKELKVLNPQYRYAIIPGDKMAVSLLIPHGKKQAFVASCDSMYLAPDSTLFEMVAQHIEYPPAPNRQYLGEKVKDLEIEGKTKIKYTIKSGDVLGIIAEEYDVRVADLKYWNNIYNERRIQVGQKLDIFVDDDKAEYYSNLQKGKASNPAVKNTNSKHTVNSALFASNIPESAIKIEHTVKSGESPYIIAKKYDGVSPEDILEWNGIKDARKIQIGQKLIIYRQ